MFGASYLRTIALVITLLGAFFCGITGAKASLQAVSVAAAPAGTTAPTVVISPASKRPGDKSFATSAYQALQNVTHTFNAWYFQNRQQIVSFSRSAVGLTSPGLGIAAFAIFVLINIPLWISRLSEYFEKIVERNSIPFAKKLGIRLEDLMRARVVLLYFFLFFLYQIVAFPLTRWNNSDIAFYADLLFNSVLIILLFGSVWDFTRGLRRTWKADPVKTERRRKWLDEKMKDIDASLPHVLKLAGSTFFVAFAPVVVTHLPDILDAIVNVDQQIVADVAHLGVMVG